MTAILQTQNWKPSSLAQLRYFLQFKIRKENNCFNCDFFQKKKKEVESTFLILVHFYWADIVYSNHGLNSLTFPIWARNVLTSLSFQCEIHEFQCIFVHLSILKIFKLICTISFLFYVWCRYSVFHHVWAQFINCSFSIAPFFSLLQWYFISSFTLNIVRPCFIIMTKIISNSLLSSQMAALFIVYFTFTY